MFPSGIAGLAVAPEESQIPAECGRGAEVELLAEPAVGDLRVGLEPESRPPRVYDAPITCGALHGRARAAGTRQGPTKKRGRPAYGGRPSSGKKPRSGQSAASPRSSVRMRTASSRGRTNTLPSPILPVLAALTIALDDLADEIVGDDDLDLHLGQEVHGVFAAAVDLGVALLAAEAFDLGDRHALNAELRQGLLHLLQFEGLDDGNNEFHESTG